MTQREPELKGDYSGIAAWVQNSKKAETLKGIQSIIAEREQHVRLREEAVKREASLQEKRKKIFQLREETQRKGEDKLKHMEEEARLLQKREVQLQQEEAIREEEVEKLRFRMEQVMRRERMVKERENSVNTREENLKSMFSMLEEREQRLVLREEAAKQEARMQEKRHELFQEQEERQMQRLQRAEQTLRLREEAVQQAVNCRRLLLEARELRLKEEGTTHNEGLRLRMDAIERKILEAETRVQQNIDREERLRLGEECLMWEAAKSTEVRLLLGMGHSVVEDALVRKTDLDEFVTSATPAVPRVLPVYGSGDCASTHNFDGALRTAESQFYRMMSLRSTAKKTEDFKQIRSIEIVRIPSAMRAFDARLSEETRRLGKRPDLKFGFHGTTTERGLAGILEKGFLVDHPELGSNGSTYGKGIYLAPRPRLAMEFVYRNQLIMAVYIDVPPVKHHRVPEDGGSVLVPDVDLVYPQYVLHFSGDS